jgi:hypothetical protein
MRVKLCARCPYSPQDLANHYDATSSNHLCVRCDGKRAPAELTILVKVNGETQCAAARNVLNSIAQQDRAPSVADALA